MKFYRLASGFPTKSGSLLPTKRGRELPTLTQDRGYHPQSPVKKVSDSLNDLEEKLTEQLAGENKALFLRFCNVYAEFMGESELDTFITGFRLGARFMMDTFLSDDAPFESFLSG